MKVRKGSSEEIPLVQGKEQWLRFAGRRIDAFELWILRNLLRVPWTARRFSGCGREPWVPSTCVGDLRQLLRVPLRSQCPPLGSLRRWTCSHLSHLRVTVCLDIVHPPPLPPALSLFIHGTAEEGLSALAIPRPTPSAALGPLQPPW